MKLSLQKIYPITDRKLSGLTHAEQVAGFIDGGATLIQIRDKHATSHELYDDALAAVKIAHAANARILINDRVDIALMTGADGVHLGQDDLPAAAAREILGDRAIIGVSTHSIEQVHQALANGNASYIAFGPIFATSTKAEPDPIVGLNSLTVVKEIVGDLPLIAIGGINSDNLESVLKAGGDTVAMISEFYQPQTEISSHFRRLLTAAQVNNTVVIR